MPSTASRRRLRATSGRSSSRSWGAIAATSHSWRESPPEPTGSSSPRTRPTSPTGSPSMCSRLKAARESGRRDSIVIVAEGARDRQGNPIAADHVKKVLEQRLQQDVRVTILGHVQRGGSPSAFDRILATQLGYAAAEEDPDHAARKRATHHRHAQEPHHSSEPGARRCRTIASSRMRSVEGTSIGPWTFEAGASPTPSSTMRTLVRAAPHSVEEGHKALRIAVLHPGGSGSGDEPRRSSRRALGTRQGTRRPRRAQRVPGVHRR